MGRTRKVPVGGAAGVLIDELIGERKVLGRAQARNAELMVEFADTRTVLDRQRIAGMRAEGVGARYKAGEFAANEVSMACSTSRFTAQRVIAMTRRVRAEAPEVWDAWRVGDIDQDKVERVNRALRRLQRVASKVLLNALVVDVAVCKSPEILGRWLNQFILETEKDLQDERLERSFGDRFVSVRPDVDGMSFLTAELSAVDAFAIDQVLTALAGVVEPGDTRTVRQRRADALVDVVLGRVTNGCHLVWDTNTDVDDHLDDPQPGDPAPDEADIPGGPNGSDEPEQDVTGNPDRAGSDDDTTAHSNNRGGDDHGGHSPAARACCGDGHDVEDSNGEVCDGQVCDIDSDGDRDAVNECAGPSAGQAWDANDWEQPASVFRPDRRTEVADTDPDSDPDIVLDTDLDSDTDPDPDPGHLDSTAPPGKPLPTNNSRSETYPTGSTRITPYPGGGQPRPLPVTIGIVVTAQSLFGFSNTPGQLMDRSAPVTANRIRELAHHQGTLFYRLLTDEKGNLLDVTELGRFPSRKLAIAVKLRDGTCSGPTCTVPATRSDIDHIIPVPEGETTAENLDDKCRNEHRAKTHAGHKSARTGPHTTEWTTPTGHKYTNTDLPFTTEKWPNDDDKQQK